MSSQYRPDISPSERTHKVIAIVNKMVSMMEGVIQVGVGNFYLNYLLIPYFLQWNLCVTLLYYNFIIYTLTCCCSSDVEICLWSYIIHPFVVVALKLVSLCFHRFRSLPQQTVLKLLHSVFPLCLFVCEMSVCVCLCLCALFYLVHAPYFPSSAFNSCQTEMYRQKKTKNKILILIWQEFLAASAGESVCIHYLLKVLGL